MQLTLDQSSLFLLSLTLFTSVFVFSLLWILCLRLKDCTWADAYWGAGFIVIAGCYILILPSVNAQQLIFAMCITIWGARLSWHLTTRHFGKREDPRYGAMRTYNGDAFWWKSYIKVFLLQAVLQWILALPIHIVFLSANAHPSMLFLSFGLVLFVMGLMTESIADYQLNVFRNALENRGKIMDTGLFAYSRHPHYAGEITLWIGIALMGFAITSSFWVFTSPILIAFLLIKVSGVAMVEANMALKNPDYAQYRARVPMILPSFFSLIGTTSKQRR